MLDRVMDDTIWRLKVAGITGAIFLAIVSIYYIVTYRHITTATVVETNWQLEIEQLQYTTLQESGWSVPAGGKVYDKHWRYHYSYQSGTSRYSCGTTKNPKTCTRPIYSDRYDWKYDYYIDRWVNIPPLVTSGKDKEDVHWPDTTDHTYNDNNTIGNIKLGTRKSHYWIIVIAEGKNYNIDMIDTVWHTYAKGDQAKLTLGYFNNIISIERGF